MTGFINRIADFPNRRTFIGGSDARIFMGEDKEAFVGSGGKTGRSRPKDLSGNLLVQLGVVTEDQSALV